jgi:uncharacterized membrane protein
VVQHAAEVLESEISAVIQVAKQVEDKSVIGARLQSEPPKDVVQRLRRDAHEVVDIFIDVFSVSLKTMDNVTNVVTLRDENVTAKPEQATSSTRSIITAPQSVKAGELAEIPISFENSANTSTEEFKLYSTDLISDSGERIQSSQISFIPTSLKVGPHRTEKVKVTIIVPKETKPGVYSGLVLAANMNQLRSEIVLKVD